MNRVRRKGFSLLEVLMAVALFGAVVTVILSAEAGLVASDKSAANMSQAIELGRCKMSELEEKELKLGFPEMEDKDSSPYCCNEIAVPGFSCEWAVERVLLPQPMQLGGDGGLSSVLGGGLGLDGGGFGGLGAGLGSLMSGDLDAGMAALGAGLPGAPGGMAINPMGGASLDFDAGLQNIGQTLNQPMAGMGGASGLLALVFSLVYPSLKPMLEAGIRRVTVAVKWNEGSQARDFTLVQYITNPSAAGLMAGMAAMGGGDGGLMVNQGGGLPGAAGPAAPVAAPPPIGGFMPGMR